MGGACGSCEESTGKIARSRVDCQARKASDGMRRCANLGYIVGGGEVRPQEDKVEAVRRCEVPRTYESVLGFKWLLHMFYSPFSNICCIDIPD